MKQLVISIPNDNSTPQHFIWWTVIKTTKLNCHSEFIKCHAIELSGSMEYTKKIYLLYASAVDHSSCWAIVSCVHTEFSLKRWQSILNSIEESNFSNFDCELNWIKIKTKSFESLWTFFRIYRVVREQAARKIYSKSWNWIKE